MKIRREQFRDITFRSIMPKSRWLWTGISFVYMVVLTMFILQNRQISAILLSRQPTLGQPVVDQLATFKLIHWVMFSFSVAMTIVAWHLWAVGRPKVKEKKL